MSRSQQIKKILQKIKNIKLNLKIEERKKNINKLSIIMNQNCKNYTKIRNRERTN